jgi:ATP-dependent DNA ligase
MAHLYKSARQSPIKLRVDIEIQGELLVATAHGTLSFHEGQRALKQVLGQAHKKQINQVLIDMLAGDGVPTTLERYELAKQIADYIRQHQMNPKIAFVGKTPTADGFAVHVAQNLGISTEIFPTRQKALNWLAAWPNPPRTKSAATCEN